MDMNPFPPANEDEATFGLEKDLSDVVKGQKRSTISGLTEELRG